MYVKKDAKIGACNLLYSSGLGVATSTRGRQMNLRYHEIIPGLENNNNKKRVSDFSLQYSTSFIL